MALVAALAALGVRAQAPHDSPQLRGSSAAGAGQMLFQISNNASFPIVLANCETNMTLTASQDHTLAYSSMTSMAEAGFFWVIPQGTTWDCDTGCPECFYVAFGLERGGGLVARIGYATEAWQEDGSDENDANDTADGSLVNATHGSEREVKLPDGAITGMELVVTQTEMGARASSFCGEDSCSPDWERDHAVAWNSTIDLVVQGSTLSASQTSLLRGFHGHVGGFHGGFHGHVGYHPHGGYHAHYGYHPHYGYPPYHRVWRPRVYRRPVWRRPIYPGAYCWRCSTYCLWRCR